MAMCVMAVVAVAPCQCFSPGGNQITSPGRMCSIGPPQRCTRPQPAVTIRVWPSGWVCHAVRAPGSNVTLAPRARAGSGASNRGSIRTLPVKYSAGPLPFSLVSHRPRRAPSFGAPRSHTRLLPLARTPPPPRVVVAAGAGVVDRRAYGPRPLFKGHSPTQGGATLCGGDGLIGGRAGDIVGRPIVPRNVISVLARQGHLLAPSRCPCLSRSGCHF
jgi:hypothetical protein